ncbi:hypothetical protein pb186bvf_020524 [Paramecium bursaria]
MQILCSMKQFYINFLHFIKDGTQLNRIFFYLSQVDCLININNFQTHGIVQKQIQYHILILKKFDYFSVLREILENYSRIKYILCIYNLSYLYQFHGINPKHFLAYLVYQFPQINQLPLKLVNAVTIQFHYCFLNI